MNRIDEICAQAFADPSKNITPIEMKLAMAKLTREIKYNVASTLIKEMDKASAIDLSRSVLEEIDNLTGYGEN